MGRAEDLGVPARLAPTVTTLVAGCDRRVEIRAAWLGGSLARGVGDDWSDIDLHLAVADPEAFDVVGWLGCIAALVLADRLPGVAGGYIFLTPDWVHLDVVVHAVSGFSQSPLPARVLLDRDALVHDVPTADPSREPYFPVEQVRVFLYFMGNAVTVLRRGELLALSQGTAVMRDQYLVPLMLAENGVRKDDGAKRLNRYLTAEQLQCLQGLPAIGLDETGLREAQRSIAAAYLSRARPLAVRCGAAWPVALERAALDLWRRELGLLLDDHAEDGHGDDDHAEDDHGADDHGAADLD